MNRASAPAALPPSAQNFQEPPKNPNVENLSSFSRTVLKFSLSFHNTSTLIPSKIFGGFSCWTWYSDIEGKEKFSLPGSGSRNPGRLARARLFHCLVSGARYPQVFWNHMDRQLPFSNQIHTRQPFSGRTQVFENTIEIHKYFGIIYMTIDPNPANPADSNTYAPSAGFRGVGGRGYPPLRKKGPVP
jgi:hypothetical protein